MLVGIIRDGLSGGDGTIVDMKWEIESIHKKEGSWWNSTRKGKEVGIHRAQKEAWDMIEVKVHAGD